MDSEKIDDKSKTVEPAVRETSKDVKELSKSQGQPNDRKRKSVASVVPQKRKKVRKRREEGAPKLPLTGYVRYMGDRRDILRTEFPDKTAVEYTKMIADEWKGMSEEQKKPYLQAAELDKERYNQELDEFMKQKGEMKKEEPTKECLPTTVQVTNIEKSQGNCKDIEPQEKRIIRRNHDPGIPVFTDEFLEHNKTVDSELKTLRKSNIDLEQQNSVLEKHIENMNFGVEKIDAENNELVVKNKLLEAYLEKLKAKLSQALTGLPIPNHTDGATFENIEGYMSDLYSMSTSNSHGPAVLNKAKDIIRKLDLQIQL